MGQAKNGLNRRNETDYAFSYHKFLNLRFALLTCCRHWLRHLYQSAPSRRVRKYTQYNVPVYSRTIGLKADEKDSNSLRRPQLQYSSSRQYVFNASGIFCPLLDSMFCLRTT